jgi:8-oxo-dGTP pyrophosphatase MutT (NUDIX family)|uniref:CCHC-type domain-containing protein n=1 Tax=viral metagenome TaxID=1070528 RepID=A0A6C0ISU5_9ZZZZ
MKSNKPDTKKSYYCSNCGKYGHISKKCTESITSLGVICAKFDNLPIKEESFNRFLSSRYIDIENYNFSHIDNISKLDYFKKNIKFLMIQRKHSLSYIEFIRGKYDIKNIDKLSMLFKNMCPEEITKISCLNFDDLWNNLWQQTSKTKSFQKEFKASKVLFEILISTNEIYNLIKVIPDYETPEWGFPKGRRNIFEKNLDCALRELEEETSLKNNKFNILHNINCVNEEYIATNNVQYKHLYYLGYMSADTIPNDYFDNINNYEVAKVKWCSWDEANSIIRDYYHEKIKVINMVYFLFLNLYIEYIGKDDIIAI